MLQTNTLSRQAYELYHSAIHKVSQYHRTLDSAALDQALIDLEGSIAADGKYFYPANFKGIVFDMRGQSVEAIAQFESILDSTPASVRGEVEFNRAIASYHQYSQEHVLKAIAILEDLVNNSQDIKLQVLARAALAQSFGMMVLHKNKQTQAPLRAQEYFNKAQNEADKTLHTIQETKGLEKAVINNASWIAYNAKAISLMFLDDPFRDRIEEEQRENYRKNLDKALEWIYSAADFSPNNWALKCNQGSIHMRLGHLSVALNNDAMEHFGKARRFLHEVLEKLRPNYDFALYEMGRTYRFQGEKEKALEYFGKALAAQGKNRNINPESIQKEIIKAENGDRRFY